MSSTHDNSIVIMVIRYPCCLLIARAKAENSNYKIQIEPFIYFWQAPTQSTSIYISNANFKLVPLGHCITYIHHTQNVLAI